MFFTFPVLCHFFPVSFRLLSLVIPLINGTFLSPPLLSVPVTFRPGVSVLSLSLFLSFFVIARSFWSVHHTRHVKPFGH